MNLFGCFRQVWSSAFSSTLHGLCAFCLHTLDRELTAALLMCAPSESRSTIIQWVLGGFFNKKFLTGTPEETLMKLKPQVRKSCLRIFSVYINNNIVLCYSDSTFTKMMVIISILTTDSLVKRIVLAFIS